MTETASDAGSAAAAGDQRPAAPAGKALRDAATVMLLRDGPTGLEVFMLRRTLNAAFVGGFYVFPGGVVDPADRSTEVEARCVGLSDAAASDRLGIDRGGLAFWVAAVRECFEEAGVLLACPAAGAAARPAAGQNGDGHVVSFADATLADRFARHRRAIHDGTLRLADMCAAEDLMLSTDAIAYVSHWITPVGEPRRFDTRFFVARAPDGQEPLHDDRETIASLWVNPNDALARADSGELQMIVPTRRNLQLLAPHATRDEAMAAALSLAPPPAILPRIVRRDGAVVILLPGEPGYDDPNEIDADLSGESRG